MKTRSELKRDYRSAPPPMGVFVVRHRASGRFQLHATRNLPGGMNRIRFEITPSTNPNLALLDDWKAGGLDAFEIAVLDELEPEDVPGWDPASDLAELEAMWRERLVAEGGTPY
ncbi:MAG TPA: GIY-YIG nuclease family protein [Anaeromyxobacteraceae bacterium]|nr:GIY-YIG nuclease family protein [Anaeromyxobacteraceae bacterium]